ncbi:MAG: hypothetical protein HN849_16850 [Victivallales bacterium]|nr:hypothetical protein [Victivallales bacterium]
MIERMHNVTVVCLGKDREDTVRQLQALGTLHVVNIEAQTGEPTAEAQRLIERYGAAISHLQARKTQSSSELPAATGEEHLAAVEHAFAAIADAQEHENACHRELARLVPWGSFAIEDVDRLHEAGYQMVLSEAKADALPELPEGAVLQEISRTGNIVYFAVIAPADIKLSLHVIPLPEHTDAQKLKTEIQTAEQQIADAEGKLDHLVAALSTLIEARDQAGDELAFLKASDGMAEGEQLAWLQGYVPERDLGKLTEAASTIGWALRHTAADRDDPNVPTFIDYDRFGIFRMAKPLFDFIGISPAYNENDVSICVLLFLTLFFGMIIGDAAYGAIFLGIGLYARAKITDPKKRVAISLFILLSSTAFIWGALNGTWFAIPIEKLPRMMQGFSWFYDEAVGQKHIQWLCFLIAGLHLSLGRAWKAWVQRDRAALGHIGWGLFIWGNFFTAVELVVTKGSFPMVIGGALYGVGTVLILVFGVKWKDVGEVLNLPFGFINSFVDVLSYIRLFAVGLSSLYIARSFNDMGGMVLELSPWLFPGAALVVLFGHLLNIALGFMGVLVHGIRLNTLEFSNHMELTWSGKPYRPLRKAESN